MPPFVYIAVLALVSASIAAGLVIARRRGGLRGLLGDLCRLHA
jgi:hypothetical protein